MERGLWSEVQGWGEVQTFAEVQTLAVVQHFGEVVVHLGMGDVRRVYG